MLLFALISLLSLGSAKDTTVGMMYEGWHAPAFFGRGTRNLTLEKVLQSNGGLTVGDMRTGWNGSLSMNFYFHKQPTNGFYCIYRKRANESVSSCGLPDCPNIPDTLARHAAMLTKVSVDYIVADSTNMISMGPPADALQLRPFEVVAEEWLALRNRGISTPQIAVWQNLQNPSGNLWEAYLLGSGVYNNPAYDQLILKDRGKKVFFVTADPDPTLKARIESLGFVVVVMWALRYNFNEGEYGFMSPCTNAGKFTTSVSSDPSQPCNQLMTTRAPIGDRGTALTVGPSFQLSYSSLPFAAAGKLGSLTLKKQFETAFKLHSQIDHLMVGTFNEHIAQPQPNPFGPDEISMGLEKDPDNRNLWVDMYGDGITRDLEPTAEDGGSLWSVFESCMRVFRSGATSCAGQPGTEPCCQLGPEDQWVNVWSLVLKGVDSLITVQQQEKDALVKQGWTEVCAPLGDAHVFCSGGPTNYYTQGPFLMHAVATTTNQSAAASSPVFRCLSPATKHFLSSDSNCGGRGKAEAVLGYASTTRTSHTPRSLRVCMINDVGQFYHSLDSPCKAGDVLLEQLGFVH